MQAILNIVVGLAVLVGGGALAITWIIFCFGTVVVGLLLLFLAPWVLFSPLMFSLALGSAMIRDGWSRLSSKT